ncbi:MAG: hypothetical protein GYA62_00680 [Bacteroidales bacterium]|nr:hypothetical protein [Bacteroidales bacterium]
MNELTSLNFIIDLYITWIIGLTPPLILRFLIFKKPLTKYWAKFTCALFLIINITVFVSLGTKSKSHSALVLIALVSYWILHRELQKNDIQNIKAAIFFLIVLTGSIIFVNKDIIYNIYLHNNAPTTSQNILKVINNDQTALLINYLQLNDYKAAEVAVNNGADVNFTIMGRSILHQSVTDNDVTDVEFLIRFGANVNTKTNYGRTPLHEAALYGHYDVTKLLIAAGADVNARNPRGETPLFYAEVGLVLGPPHTPMNDKVATLLRSHGAKR